MCRGSIMKILHRPGRPSMVHVWQQPIAPRLSVSAPAALVASAPRPGACRICCSPRGWAGMRAPHNHWQGDQLAGSQATSTLNFSKRFTSCFILKICLQGLNLKWEAVISGFFQLLASLYSGLNSYQAMNNRVR